MEIQNRLQDFVLYLDQAKCFIDTFFIFSCYNRHNIALKTDMAVDQETVIRARLRVCLPRLCVALCILRHILPGINCLDARNFHCDRGVDRFYHRIRIRGTQKFDDQAVLRRQIIHVNRLSGYQLHRIFFSYRSIDYSHSAASFCFSLFQSKNARMPRSCPS